MLAGGTDLMVNAPHRPVPAGIVDLWAAPSCAASPATARPSASAPARPGSTSQSALVAAHAPILGAAAREIGALQIQARGTIGGNVATSSPVGDSLPVLLALDATLELASPRGRRAVPYRDFATGYRTTALAADELIAAVVVPVPDAPRA
ncbi:MAG: FAD binding domain-containing protein [Kofleriaceae bacterium]|nr:FAD binding domain-containing protein [Kofleriaceae bacterium]